MSSLPPSVVWRAVPPRRRPIAGPSLPQCSPIHPVENPSGITVSMDHHLSVDSSPVAREHGRSACKRERLVRPYVPAIFHWPRILAVLPPRGRPRPANGRPVERFIEGVTASTPERTLAPHPMDIGQGPFVMGLSSSGSQAREGHRQRNNSHPYRIGGPAGRCPSRQ